jgi:hypothetical protein
LGVTKNGTERSFSIVIEINDRAYGGSERKREKKEYA